MPSPEMPVDATNTRVSLLLIEDNRADAFLTKELLHFGSATNNSDSALDSADPPYREHLRITTCTRLTAALELLKAQRFDIILLDLLLPDSRGLSGLHSLNESFPEIPVVVLSGIEDEKAAINAVHEGAEDFLIKGKVDEQLLRRSIFYAIERHKIRRELSEAKHIADEAARAKGDFIARMSHEIRTPLTPIVTYAEMLLGGQVEPEQRSHALQIILASVTHLQHLIDDVLDVAKLDSGKFEVSLSRCSPVEIVEEALSIVSPRAEAKALTTDAEYLPPLPESVVTDGFRLKQILINLLGNAVKFTSQGAISLSLACDSAEETLIFEVADSGIGIAPDDLDKLFKPFSQVDGSSTRGYGGTGLGLFISRELAQKLGGQLTCESLAGEGSIFSLTIPTGSLANIRMMPAPARGSLYKPYRISEPPRLSGKILLAEDGVENRAAISHILRTTGVEVEAVENGAEAVTAASNGEFALVLMDMHMPVLDGIAAAKQLRARGCQVPIIALTANRTPDAVIACTAAGFNDFVTKPFRSEELFSTLQKYLVGNGHGAA